MDEDHRDPVALDLDDQVVYTHAHAPLYPVILLLLGCAHRLDLVKLEVGGEQRSYFVHVPEGQPAGGPLVFVFHGGGPKWDHKGRRISRITGFDAVADRERFVTVYPNAVDGNWNDGQSRSERDDVAYVDVVLQEVLASTGADPAQVYATGFSNGGFFGQRLACERAERFGAVASVAATFPVGLACAPAEPIRVMVVAGTDDPVIPYGGGVIAGDRGMAASVDEVAAAWLGRNACDEAPVATDRPDLEDDGTTVYDRRWCAGPSEVRVLEIRGGGHSWPGGRQYLPRFVIGRVSREVEASEEIWAWFEER